jgi:4,5-dihydroxyphthalate decarboxylase
MTKLITFAGGIYDRSQALAYGQVKPDGLELNWLTFPYREIWRRMLNNYEFDASELSFSSYIIARTLGKPLIAIPVFPARAFRHSYVFVNTESGIKNPQDLSGKRVGIHEFQQTASVWVKGILENEYGVNLQSIRWFTWAAQTRMEVRLSRAYDLQKIPHGSNPDQMLLAGELDAIITPAIFQSFIKASNVRRLFENYKEVEANYYKATGIFPIMHTVAIREELWRDNPWIAVSLFTAFQKSKQLAYDTLNSLGPYKISLAWLREPVTEQQNILGEDPWIYGLRQNSHVIETLVRYLHQQGLIDRDVEARELFARNTWDL